MLDLIDPVALAPVRRLHQAEIVDHHQIGPAAAMERPGSGRDHLDGERGRLVDLDGQVVEPVLGDAEPPHVTVVERAAPRPVAADAGDDGQEPVGDEMRLHLE